MSDNNRCVSMVCVSFGGVVSILRDLSLDEAAKIRTKLLRLPAPGAKLTSLSYGITQLDSSDIKTAEIV